MPIYDYRCNACGHRFELRQSFTDEARANCTQCGQPAQRILHPVGIVFKGSGWHSTDYRSSGARSGGSDKSDGAGDESKSEPKAEAKPESKSETKSESSTASTT